MSDAVLAALLTGSISLIGTVITVLATSRKQSALLEYRLKKLEEKQDKHNQVIERTYRLEDRANLMDVKMKVVDHRIDDLERERCIT